MRARLFALAVVTATGLGAQGTAAPQSAGPPSAAASAPAVAQRPEPVTANDSAIDARTTAIASQLRCPVCQGVSVQDSPAELAQQMRALVREQVALGKSDAEVREFFLKSYGEFILLAPRPRGFNLLAYLLPPLLLAAGAWFVMRNVKRWTAPAADPAAATSAPPEPPATS
jgi:cytochrome c-type biogenesis protein CcmH